MSHTRAAFAVLALLAFSAAAVTDLALMQTFVSSLSCSTSYVNWATETDLCSWDGVDCDSNNNPYSFEMTYDSCDGSVTTWALPATITTLYMYGNSLTGTVPSFATLPVNLTDFEIQNNDFTGSLTLTNLPNMLTTISMYGCSFTGSVDLTHLPTSLTEISLENNMLSGTVDLTKLPASLEYMYLEDNQFTGLIVTNFSSNLEEINLSYNNLNGLNMNFAGLSPNSQSGVLQLYSNPGICGTYTLPGCYGVSYPYQCSCTSAVLTCTCTSVPAYTPYPFTPLPPFTPYPPYTPYPYTPYPPYTWSPSDWTPYPYSWSPPASWSPSSWEPSPVTPSTPVPQQTAAATAVYLTVYQYSYSQTYTVTDAYMATTLANYFNIPATSMTITHVTTTGSSLYPYTTYMIQFTNTKDSTTGMAVSASTLAYDVSDYYYNDLYYSLHSANFAVQEVTLNYYPSANKDAPTKVYITVYQLYSGTAYSTDTKVVQGVLAGFFMVDPSSISVSKVNSTSYYTTFSVSFSDSPNLSTKNQVMASTEAYALVNYQYNGLNSAFNGVNMGISSASADASDSSTSKVPIIVGVIVGVVVLIAIIAFIANRQSSGTGSKDQDYVSMGGKPMV